jgi:hypothetical protein
MSQIPFEQLPDESRVWIFNTERTLSPAERRSMQDELDRFVAQWAAHRKDLTAGYTIRYDQFIILGVDESKLPPSGCSIDAMVRFLRELGSASGIQIVDAPDVCYRSSDAIVCVDRNEFGRRVERGEVSADTIVFNGMVDRLGDLRAGRWELPARESWHGRAYELREVEGV